MDSPDGLDGVVCSGERETPYISIVATARNDNHGGNLLGRMQIFVDAWINQARRHNLSSELVLVEWNPPADKPGLAQALRWPPDTGPCRVRIIQVPPELHRRYRHAEALPLYQMIAKNVGIRRARGQFILVTNIDIVFSDDLVRFLARRELQKGCLYRIDRTDVATDVPVDGTLDEQLAWCRAHVIRLCARHGIFNLTPDGLRQSRPNDIVRAGSGIYLGEGWFEAELYTVDYFRWIENDADVFLRVPPGGGVLGLEVEPGPGVGPDPQPMQVFDAAGTKVAEWSISGHTSMRLRIPPAESGLQRIRLHVPSGGLPVPNDPRIMNFRFFRCDWIDSNVLVEKPRPIAQAIRAERHTLARMVEAMLRAGPGSFLLKGPAALWKTLRLLRNRGPDIFDASAEFQVVHGWYELERRGSGTFRWARDGAELIFTFKDGTTSLALIVEPGPAIGYEPFELVVRLRGGAVAAKAPIHGLTYLEFPLEIEPGERISVSFQVEGPVSQGGSGVPSDTRTLDFRVFACGRGTRKTGRVRPGPGDNAAWAAKIVGIRPPDIDWEAELSDRRKEIDEMGKPEFLHLYACGDFQLMACEDWIDVRGYAELDQFSFHLDSLLSYTAHHLGIREQVLTDPMRIYHIEHGIGSGWTPEGHNTLMERINRQGIDNLVFKDLAEIVAQMRRLHAPLIFNLDNWGMAELDLKETNPSGTLAGQGVH